MDSITSVDQMIQSFQGAKLSKQLNILKNLDIPTSEFLDFASWTEDSYTRNCLARCDEFEFILICWDGNCQTQIHDHDGQNCWVYQIVGNLREVRYNGNEKNLQVYKDDTLEQGDVSYMNDKMGYHRIENPDDHRAMTLHIYVKPIDRCKVYDEVASQFKIARMEYDSVCEISEVA